MAKRTRAGGPLLAAAVLLTAGCTGRASADEQTDALQYAQLSVAAQQARQDPNLPAGAQDALARLAASPRHGEWQVVRSGADSIRAWVVYPERNTRAPVVLVVHEIFGLSHWVRGVADQLAAEGFIAIAPDLLTMKGVPTGPDGAPDAQRAQQVIRELAAADVHRWLRAVAAHGMSLPSATSRYGIVGYCWGGQASFMHAVTSPALGAAVVYYGPSPEPAQLASVRAPVLGLYAGDDARVNQTVPPAAEEMRRLNKTFDVHTFTGAGHGFLRQQDGRDGANLRATRQAWPLTIDFLKRYLE
jgi:carboxymethylenebutenolidase